MEDSLYGFRFRPQSSLLVSDEVEIDDAETEPMQWQEPGQYELPHSYCDEATQTPNWDYQDQRVDASSSRAPRGREADQHQSESTALNTTRHIGFFKSKDQVDAYETCAPWDWSRFPIVQPSHIKEEEFDESMDLIIEDEPLEADDASYERYSASVSHRYVKRESGSDTSTMTMVDLCEEDEGAACEMVVDEDSFDIEDGDIFDFEDEFLFDESARDVGDGRTRRRVYGARSETEDMCE
ncbi:hypothetical protein J3F83DRAFT_716481 [Trichoderma novae-zelandiae]